MNANLILRPDVTDAQRAVLEAEYAGGKYAHAHKRTELAERIGTTADMVKIWFQHRRYADRPRNQVHGREHERMNPRQHDNILAQANLPVTAEIAIPRQLLQAFPGENLNEADFNDITENEEMVFQNVLKKKMTCEICLIGLKRFRCLRCFNAMCRECTNKIFNLVPGLTPCPHCREPNEQFMPIIMPRL